MIRGTVERQNLAVEYTGRIRSYFREIQLLRRRRDKREGEGARSCLDMVVAVAGSGRHGASAVWKTNEWRLKTQIAIYLIHKVRGDVHRRWHVPRFSPLVPQRKRRFRTTATHL